MDPIREIYEKQVRPLRLSDRVRLARLIVGEIAEAAPMLDVDMSDVWSEEDLTDLSRAAIQRAGHALGDEPKAIQSCLQRAMAFRDERSSSPQSKP